MTSYNKPYNLIDFRKNKYSQYGEDGILAKILKEININNGWFVEFGAWDGEYLSNTKLLLDNGCKGIYIEGDVEKYNDLKKKYSDNERVVTINAMIESSGDKTLDNIFASTSIPDNFDILSIDIDGNDYHVWESLKNYSPKIVIIESNPTFPYNVEFVQKENEYIGSSALSLYMLGLKKGYKIVCYNTHNCIFVRHDIFHQLNLINSSFAYLYHIGRQGTAGGFFASTYDGNWHWIHPQMLGWGAKSVEFPNRLLLRGHYLKFIFSSQINIFRQIFKHISKKTKMNEYFVKKGKIFKILDDSQEISSLFK